VVTFLVSAVLLLLADPIAHILLGEREFAPLVRVASLTLLFTNLSEIPRVYWRVQQKTALYVAVNLARTVLGVLAVVYFLVIAKQGVQGVVYANLLTNAVAGTAMFATVLASLPRRVDRHKLLAMLRYGAPLIVQSLATFVLVFSDRFFLRYYANLNEVGVYSLGYKLASIVTVLVSLPFGMTWQWQQFELAKSEDARGKYAKIQTYWLLVSVFVGLGVSVLARDVLRIVAPPSYWAGAAVVPLIVLSYVLADVRSVIVSGILVQQATHRLIPISLAAAAINLLLNFLLVSRYHAMGAAVATALSYAAGLVLAHYVAQRTYFVRYEYGRNILILAGATLIYLVSTLIHLPLISSLLVNTLLLATFGLMLFWLLNREERVLFRDLGRLVGQRMFSGNQALAE